VDVLSRTSIGGQVISPHSPKSISEGTNQRAHQGSESRGQSAVTTGPKTATVTQDWPKLYARIAGALYLIVIVGGTFAELFVRARLVVPGNAVATAHNILVHDLLYRLGFVVELFYCVCNVPLLLILYNLFKVVNKNVAMTMLGFAFLADAIESMSLLAHLAPLEILSGGTSLRAFTVEQLDAATYLAVQLFERGFAISLVFFGFACLTMANLILRSWFIPRIIGALLAIEGVGYLINSVTLFLSPALHARIFPYFSATAIAEVALCLWLLVMGVNVQRWNEQADASE
jgi:hypothetical protein